MFAILYFFILYFQQIHNQSENHDISEEPKKLKFAPIIILIW